MEPENNVQNQETENVLQDLGLDLFEDRILVLGDDNEEIFGVDAKGKVVAGGLLIPDKVKETGYERKTGRKGTVVWVGSGFTDIPMNCKVGDRVLYGEHAGTEIEHRGVIFLMMRAGELIGRVNENLEDKELNGLKDILIIIANKAKADAAAGTTES